MRRSKNSKQYAKENTGLKPDKPKATRKKKRTIAKEKKVNGSKQYT
tara:strand:+ start:370 stop:507 length:138 start_codon:yes stop_codon:yes gene_type:complete